MARGQRMGGDVITVRGGGVFALASAYVLARRGARLRLIAPHGIADGASGGPVGALSPHVPERWEDKKQFQLESLLQAQAFWDGVTQVAGEATGYGRTGRVQPLADARAVELAHERIAGAKSYWQGQARWQILSAQELSPLVPASPTGLYSYDDLSARISPARACHALARAVSALGADVVLGQDAPDTATVVHATGLAGFAALETALGHSVGAGEKGQAALLAPHGVALRDLATLPQIYAGYLHIVPHQDGRVGVGATSERYYETAESTDAQLDTLIARARALCPWLETAPVVTRWASLRPRSATRAPLAGPWPGRPGHYVLNGGFKIGFGLAPRLAEAMADLVLEGKDLALPEGFRL